MKNIQTADVLRPKTFDDIVGQPHLFGQRGVLRRMVEGGRIPNMIFYGPPGVGKTTAAEIIAAGSGMTFHRLNATTASLSDVKDVIAKYGRLKGITHVTSGLFKLADNVYKRGLTDAESIRYLLRSLLFYVAAEEFYLTVCNVVGGISKHIKQRLCRFV